MNSNDQPNISEEIQNFLSLNQDTLMNYLIRQCDLLSPIKVLNLIEEKIHEVVFETNIDGTPYYLVRCQPKPLPTFRLSPRELMIARLIAQGLPNKCISERLQISCWTVNTHLRRIFTKLGVTSRAAMVAQLMDAHLLEDISQHDELIS